MPSIDEYNQKIKWLVANRYVKSKYGNFYTLTVQIEKDKAVHEYTDEQIMNWSLKKIERETVLFWAGCKDHFYKKPKGAK